MVRPDALTLENDGTPWRRTYDRVSGGDGDPPSTDFKLHHRSVPEA
jgi:hypothetical protein